MLKFTVTLSSLLFLSITASYSMDDYGCGDIETYGSSSSCRPTGGYVSPAADAMSELDARIAVHMVATSWKDNPIEGWTFEFKPYTGTSKKSAYKKASALKPTGAWELKDTGNYVLRLEFSGWRENATVLVNGTLYFGSDAQGTPLYYPSPLAAMLGAEKLALERHIKFKQK